MNGLNSPPIRRRVVLAGFVRDALTRQHLSGVTLKLCQAPDLFVQRLVTQVRVFGLPASWVRWRSPPPPRQAESAPPVLQDFYAEIANPQLNGTVILNRLQQILTASAIANPHKLLALQALLDVVPSNAWYKQKINDGRTQTALDGWFYFTDLPMGQYQLEATLPSAGWRYGKTVLAAEVKDLERKLPLAPDFSDILKLKLELPPTTILGNVFDAKTQERIDSAKINLTESHVHTLTSRQLHQDQHGQWNYRLVAIEPALPFSTLQVSAPGYVSQQQQIALKPGEVKQCDLHLVPQS
jgi:hypothetical protein